MTRSNNAMPAFDQRLLRNALGRFATGITVITTRTLDGRLEGLTANSFASVSLEPPLVLWSLDRATSSLPDFQTSGFFAVSVLGQHQRAVAHNFAESTADKFATIAWSAGHGGCPLLDDRLASFECSTERQIEAGDHIIFLGRVLNFDERVGEPLVFSGGHYTAIRHLPDETEDRAEEDLGFD
ncbi:MAG: flavin reductase family protein [Pseudomonadota bacterium]